MSEKISISELEAVERAMTGERWCVQGPWPQPTIYVDDAAIADESLHPTHVATISASVLNGQSTSDDHDAAGIVALRNAAPALLAIAKAALAYARPIWTEQDARDKEVARVALNEALSEVRP